MHSATPHRSLVPGLSFALLLACFAAVTNAGAQSSTEQARRARTQRHLSGRTLPQGASAARALDLAKQQHQAMLARRDAASLTAAWTSVGPAQVTTQEFGNVTGRVTSIAIDPVDATGNTVYLGTSGGGVWKSTNAAGPAASVTFAPLTDALPVFNSTSVAVAPSLSIGSLAIGGGVVLAGTGDSNDATDSYYGAGILRSSDGGVTWTLAQQSLDGASGNHSFFGLSVAGLAFSSATPTLAVAGLSQAVEGTIVNAVNAADSQMGLYYSTDAGQTWHMATVMDGSQTLQSPNLAGTDGGGNAVTSVVWNPLRQSFYAAIRGHGYYGSKDGITWTRLLNQPGAGLTTTACPAVAGGAATCPIFRGALAVQSATGDLFALTTDSTNTDRGLYQDLCAASGNACGNTSVTFANKLNTTPLEVGSGSAVIDQASYNLTLAAVPNGSDTLVFAGTVDLYRCSLAAGCAFRDTTNAQNGCANPAGVAPAQHALAALAGGLVYIGNDGGLWRSTDGVDQLAQPCSPDDATHFQNLNSGLGSLAEVVSFAQAPASATTLLAGLGALGTAGTSTVTNPWTQLSTGEGGTVAIDPASPQLWYLSTGAGISIARCASGSACTPAQFSSTAIGAAQVANDIAAMHAPWLLDPGDTANLIAGTCRVWRGPATGGSAWTSANDLSRPFATPAASACGATAPVVRSLAAGGAVASSTNAQNAGSTVLYAGLAGSLDGGSTLAGHLFVTTAANLANNATAWTDAAKSAVSNDVADSGVFNPGGFDISSIAADPHDATGGTIYATAMGFSGSNINAPHVYRSTTAGTSWTNISSNLPNAPANSIVVDPNDANTLYVALDTGVYVTTSVTTCSSSNCWSVFGTALPNAPVVQLAASAAMPTSDGRTGELRAATYGRGIWQIPLLTAAARQAPAMTINPTSVTYPARQVGTASAYATLTITNTGNAPLQVSSVAVTGDFNETDTCTAQTIAQNATCTVQVQFLPAVAGTRTGVLTVYGNVAGGQVTASLTGTGLTPAAVVLTPITLTFPSTDVGATSAVQYIAISNTGGSATTLQTPAISGSFRLSANTCTSSLAAGVGCTVGIAFAPTASGAASGMLTVVDSAGTQVASLTGTGTNPPTDTLSPASLSFAAQQLNTSSAAQNVTITNSGDDPLTLVAAQIASGDFSVVNNCGATLIAHATCALTVTYSPKSVGAESGTLAITDEFRTQTVPLTGIGLAPPGVSLSPFGSLAFAATGVSLTSAPQAVTLTNNGGVALAISGIVSTGDFSLLPGGNTCGATLAPAAACTIQIVFTPTVAGARTGTVTFSDNAAGSPQSLALSGTGVDFTLASNGPSSITIASGQTATYALLLTSAAGLPGSATFTCSGAPAHSLCTVNPGSAALGSTATISVTVATGLPKAALEPPALPWQHPLLWLAALLPLGLAAKRTRRFVALAALLALSACSIARTIPSSTSSTTPTVVTPSGTYSIVVAGSSTGLVRSVNLTLVVQ